MNFISLCAGIGGFDLGFEAAGMTCVAQCELDPYCQEVLNKHWPDVPIYADLRTLTGEQLEADGITDVSLLCGGYPCQPFSVAGKRQGEADDRHLWPEIERLLAEFIERGSPITWVCFENVAGHITMGLDSVLAELGRLGYTCWPVVLPACGIGAYHRRNRVFILGTFTNAQYIRGRQEQESLSRRSNTPVFGNDGEQGTLGYSEHDGRITTEIGGRDQEADGGSPEGQVNAVESQGAGGRGHHETVADTDRTGQQPGPGRGSSSESSGQVDDSGRGSEALSNTVSQRGRSRPARQQHESEHARGRQGSEGRDARGMEEGNAERRLGGEIDGVSAWLDGSWEEGVPRVARGKPGRTQRLKQLGNAIVPQLTEMIGRAIVQAESENTGVH